MIAAAMGLIETARQILSATETSLREVIERALAEQQYSDVAAIAQMADTVARLRGTQAETPTVTSPASPSHLIGGNGEHPPAAPAKPVRRRRPANGEFPRFERDGDKLVKIGWSKRDDRVYEHRAPRDIVFRVTNAIVSKRKAKSIFTMDQVLPITDPAGKEIPSYQAYLALAWLRSVGVVQRRGKDGYALVNPPLETSKLQQLWSATPSKS